MIVLAIGGVLLLQTHRVQPTEIDGTIDGYTEHTRNNVYDRNELLLHESASIYTLDKHDFHPPLPERVFKDGKVSIWVDGDSHQILAITLYDENDENPTKYTTTTYDDPDAAVNNSYIGGGIVAGLGVLVALLSLLWPLTPWGRRQAARPWTERNDADLYVRQDTSQSTQQRPR